MMHHSSTRPWRGDRGEGVLSKVVAVVAAFVLGTTTLAGAGPLGGLVGDRTRGVVCSVLDLFGAQGGACGGDVTTAGGVRTTPPFNPDGSAGTQLQASSAFTGAGTTAGSKQLDAKGKPLDPDAFIFDADGGEWSPEIYRSVTLTARVKSGGDPFNPGSPPRPFAVGRDPAQKLVARTEIPVVSNGKIQAFIYVRQTMYKVMDPVTGRHVLSNGQWDTERGTWLAPDPPQVSSTMTGLIGQESGGPGGTGFVNISPRPDTPAREELTYQLQTKNRLDIGVALGTSGGGVGGNYGSSLSKEKSIRWTVDQLGEPKAGAADDSVTNRQKLPDLNTPIWSTPTPPKKPAGDGGGWKLPPVGDWFPECLACVIPN